MKHATIKVFQVKGKDAGPVVLISAGVHGDEYEPMLAAVELCKKLPRKLVAGSVSIVALVNEGAYLLGNRCGKDGIDLARICPGTPDGNGTETAASEISDMIRKADYYIDMHTGGKLFRISPFSGYMLHASEDVLLKQQKMASAFNLPVIWGTDNSPNGRTLSVARDANVPAIYVEYGGGDGINRKIIDRYTKGCMNVLKSLNMIKGGHKTGSEIKYWVEDDLPDSGYLQGKMPAPVNGVFIPGVKLGDKILKDQFWGSITGLPDGDENYVKADRDGIVLFMRTGGYVRQGDSLGGILSLKNLKRDHS